MKEKIIKMSMQLARISNMAKLNKTQDAMYGYMLSLINDKAREYKKEKKEFDLYDLSNVLFSVKGFINEYNKISKNKLNYSRIKEYSLDLGNKKIKLKGYIDNVYYEGYFNIFADTSISIANNDIKTGLIEVHFNEKFVKSFLKIQAEKGFIKYKWQRKVNINNINGNKLYEYFKTFEYIGISNKDRIHKEYISLNDLYELLLSKNEKGEFEDKRYIKDRNHFEARILDPACKSFNNSDLKLFEYDYKLEKGKNKGEIIKKFYQKEKEGYFFVVDYTNSDYFSYHKKDNFIIDKETIKDNQNRYNSNHRKKGYRPPKEISRTPKEEDFFDNDFYNNWEKENQKRIGQELFSHGFFK